MKRSGIKPLLNIKKNVICSPCGLPATSKFTSIHPEHKAIENYIYHQRPRYGKKITIIVWRNSGKNNKLVCAKPCGLCVKRTLPRLCKILRIHPILLEIYYSTSTGFVKSTLHELMNTKQIIHQFR